MPSKKLAEKGDYVSLPGEQEYNLYFEQMRQVFTVLDSWCEQQAKGGKEESLMLKLFLERMLTTIELLRERQRFRPECNLKLDLNESGFPHQSTLAELNVDYRRANDRLSDIPSIANLKEDALDSLFKNKESPIRELSQMAERNYFEALRGADFMGPFRFGGFKLKGQQEKRREYMTAWACYNSADNLLYLHTMLFEQDTRAKPLEEKRSTYEELKEVITAEGKHVPPLGVMAIAIDSHIDSIHPKILKRTRIGPLTLPRFTFSQNNLACAVKGLGKPTDFSIQLKTETVFSKKEVIKEKGSWFRADIMRNVFAIPETDKECFEAKVSLIHNYLILPHHLMQHLRDADPETLGEYENYEMLVYENDGRVHSM